MTVTDFQSLVSNALLKQKEIIHILDSDTSLLVSCENNSCFYVNILESKQVFIHDNHEENWKQEYLSTHSKTYASNLNASGVPLDCIREMLGHSSLSTTLGYIYNPLTESETYNLITKAL